MSERKPKDIFDLDPSSLSALDLSSLSTLLESTDPPKPHVTYLETVRETASVSREHQPTDAGTGQPQALRLAITLTATDTPRRDEDPFAGLDAAGLSQEQADAVRQGFLAGLTPCLLPDSSPGLVQVTVDQVEVTAGTPTVEVFREAARLTAEDLTAKATWQLMEPVFKIEITVPATHKSAVYSLITSKGGQITEETFKGSSMVQLDGTVPVRISFGLTTELRKATGGTAFPQMTFSHWEVVSDKVLEQLRSEGEAQEPTA
ncbi:hypothetical protein ACFWJT_32045 [Streptomyces sp. NPDC127069]|uniref:hypothetical protein n=1 Tax=Streptomyces sp. NPDC127069 TaxID=3347128 RepID=UPI00364D9548